MADPILVYQDSDGQSVTDNILIDGRPLPDINTYTVSFLVREADSDTIIVDSPATIVDADEAQVRYEWEAADLVARGEFKAWWRVTSGTEDIDTPEFLVVITEHAPGVRARTGAIYEFCRSHIPSTWNALEKDTGYGDLLLQRRIDVQKARLFASPPAAEDERDLDVRVQSYIAKLTVLNLMSTAMEYWMNQREMVSATGTAESSTYPERIQHLKQIRDQLTREVIDERDEIEGIIDLSPINSINAVPEFSPGIEEGFKTPLPGVSFPDYAFPQNPDSTLW